MYICIVIVYMFLPAEADYSVLVSEIVWCRGLIKDVSSMPSEQKQWLNLNEQ